MYFPFNALLLYIYIFFFSFPSDEHFSLIISNLFKQVILNKDRYLPSAGNSTYRLFTFYFSISLYSVTAVHMLSEFTGLTEAKYIQICNIWPKCNWITPWKSCLIFTKATVKPMQKEYSLRSDHRQAWYLNTENS